MLAFTTGKAFASYAYILDELIDADKSVDAGLIAIIFALVQ